MAEATICLFLLLIYWHGFGEELIESWKVFQQASHDLKEARAAHKIRIAELRTTLKRIKERARIKELEAFVSKVSQCGNSLEMEGIVNEAEALLNGVDRG